ncbi:MAG: PAS domain-containing protein, partial [Planctomycetia bacterium]|nr:PAS domain-containing protein [Planctomycetia bacterium]
MSLPFLCPVLASAAESGSDQTAFDFFAEIPPFSVSPNFLVIFLLVFAVLFLLLFSARLKFWLNDSGISLEKVRKESGEKKDDLFYLTLDFIGDGVIIIDAEGKIVRFNPVVERMLGISSKNALGLPHDQIFRFVSVDGDDPIESPLTQTLQSGEVFEQADPVHLVPISGDTRYPVSFKAIPIRKKQGKTIGVILTFRDLSEEFKRRSEIQTEFDDWEVAEDLARVYHFRLNMRTFEVKGNKNLSKVWPIKYGRSVRAEKWVYFQDLPVWIKNFNDLRSGARERVVFQYRVLQKGLMRHFRGVVRRDLESPHEVIGIIQELTDFVQGQEQQNAVQKLWTACVNMIPTMIFIKSVNNGYKYLQCNLPFARFVGRLPEEIVGRTDSEIYPDLGNAAAFRDKDQYIMSSGKPQEFHEQVTDTNGVTHRFYTMKVPAEDMEGNPILLGISTDESEDYRLRVELEMLLKNWEIASEIADIVTFRINFKTMEINGTPRFTEFWPIRDGKAVPADEWVYPDDVDLCVENHEAVLSGRLPQSIFVYRVEKSDGMHYYRIYIRKLGEDSEEITGLIQDVTSFNVVSAQKEAVLKMWEKIVDSVPAIFYIKDVEDDFRYLQCNRNISSLFDRTPDQVIGHTDKDMYHQIDDANAVRESDLLVMKSGTSLKEYELIQDAHGVVHRFETVRFPAKNENGHSVLIGMMQEVNELHELSEIRRIISSAFEILFSERDQKNGIRSILRMICEYIGFNRAYVSCVDEKENATRFYATYMSEGESSFFDHPAFADIQTPEALNDQTRDSVLEKAFFCDFSKEEDLHLAEIHIPHLWAVRKEYDIRGVHVNWISVNGKPWGTIGFITQYKPVKKTSKNELHLLEMIAHIIELAVFREQTMEQLEAAVKDAQDADKAKSFFLASMSHEIRTPLNAIIGFADLLKDFSLTRQVQQEYLSSIAFAGNSLLQLINDILDLSKLEAGQFVFIPEKTDISDLCSEIIAVFSHSAIQKNLKLELSAGSFPELYFDRLRLRQILFNLVGNAIKFTSTGGVKV